jgi:hypothetical protein
MLTASCRRITIVLLLTILAAPWSSAALPRAASACPIPAVGLPSLLDGFWRFVRIVWTKEGCHIDPDGRCTPDPAPQPTQKEGCHIDPNGQCIQ